MAGGWAFGFRLGRDRLTGAVALAAAQIEKLTTSTACGTVSAAVASGDTQAIVDLASRMGAAAAAQPSATEEEQQPAQPYRQTVAERQPEL